VRVCIYMYVYILPHASVCTCRHVCARMGCLHSPWLRRVKKEGKDPLLEGPPTFGVSGVRGPNSFNEGVS